MIGIYKIQNLTNNKVYVGSSKSLKRRQYQHFFQLKNNKHGNAYLQYSYNKYGKESFVFYILEECTEEELIDRESYWIEYYNSANPISGYNLDSFECGRRKLSSLSKAKMKNSNREKKKINQFDLFGNLLNTFDSIKESARKLNIDRRAIQGVLTKKHSTTKGYVFRYLNEQFSFDSKNICEYYYGNIASLLKKPHN